MKKKRSTFFKTAAIGLSAIATSLVFGMSAACSTSSGSTDNEDDKTTTKVDDQKIKNGNFEFYSDNDGLYPISSPNNWTGGTNGNSSSSMSGIINTNKERWDYFASDELAQELEANDDRSSGDSDKKDYNGALQDDLPYKNTHEAIKSDATDEQKEFIDNPFTREYRYDADGKVYNSAGEVIEPYKGDDDKWYYKDADDKEQPFETSVLMLHNYRSGSTDFKGTESYFNSTTTITLEASTAAKISVWVKTAELYFDGANATRTEVDCERGAYIKVKTEVGGNDIDDFTIENINTQKLNPAPTTTEGEGDDAKTVIDYENWDNNGWVQYTVFVEASNFADTTVTLSLGLGKSSTYTVEGYAFFDDIEFTHYLNSAAMAEANSEFTSEIRDEKAGDREVNVSHPLAPDAQMNFRVDKKSYTTNDSDGNLVTDKIDKYNSEDRYFSINLASSDEDAIDLANSLTTPVAGGLTVDETTAGKFVSAKPASGESFKTAGVNVLDNSADVAKLPVDLRSFNDGKGLKVSDDFIITTAITDGWSFPAATTDATTAAHLEKTLGTAANLPGADGSTSALVMLSARGAAYEAQITNNKFVLNDGEYVLVSFWIKTSDMDGNTAATVKAVDVNDKTNSSSTFSVDSTAQATVTIGDAKDVYDGWVKCFVRVSNTSKATEPKEFKLVVNFGNTSISGTNENSYDAGWLAISNMAVTELDEDVFGYTSSASHSTSLAFTETTPNTSHNFDTPMGDENVIKTDLAIPSSYTGVFGAGRHVDPDTAIEDEEYNETNAYDYAGLLNRENFIAGKYDIATNAWYNLLTTLTGLNNRDYKDVWNTIFDEYCVQPLIIVNTVQTFDSQTKIFNYGYIGDSSDISVSANNYRAISVRVKASAGAIANVYLVEDKSNGKTGTYTLPEYNFWYDDDGNMLKSEPADDATIEDIKELTAYTLRSDGLYENDDGKLYANFYNLSRYYDISDEQELTLIYNEAGEPVSFDGEGFVQGEIYYADKEKTTYAPHYLIAGDDTNNKVYKYNSGTGDDVSYYYMEYKDSTVITEKVVYGVDKTIARYKNSNDDAVKYSFTVDGNDPAYTDKWVTVTFYVHAGNKEINNYRLELWSGERDKISSYDSVEIDGQPGTKAYSYVIFDYSSISLDETTFTGLRDEYTNAIIGEYKKDAGELANNDANIADFEKLTGEKLSGDSVYNYDATYYTFSLYDATDFRPFNAETAENGETGYSYVYSENDESLALLKVEDKENLSMSAFIDYSVVDKDHETIGAPTVPDDSGSTTTPSDSDNDLNVWLLAASIALIVAIFVAIAAVFIRDFVKKHGRKKTAGKNSYNFNKNKRYVKKYVKANGEAPEIAEGELDESLLSDKPDGATVTETEATAEETTVEETPDEATPTAETNADEQTADEEAPAESEEKSVADEGENPDDGKQE